MDRRTAALDAALCLIGRDGMRALTHRAVDAEAALPVGTTSNHFRTRHALIEGVLGRLLARDVADMTALQATPPASVSELGRLIVGYVAHAAGPGASLTRARYALFVEVAGDDALREAVGRHRAALHARAVAMLAPFVDDPARASAQAGLLVALVDGLILHRVTGPEPSGSEASQSAALLVSLLDKQGNM